MKYKVALAIANIARGTYSVRAIVKKIYAPIRRAVLLSLVSPSYKLGRILNTGGPNPRGRALIRFSQRIHGEFLFEGMLRRGQPAFTKVDPAGLCVSRAIQSANREMSENRSATSVALDAIRNEMIREKKRNVRRK